MRNDVTSARVELVQDLAAGDYLPDYGAAVVDVDIVTDPYPEPAHASVRLADGRTLWLATLDDIAVGESTGACAATRSMAS
ncbi:hypothetical protein MycrhDRAFT_5704 [Mycolicibacterium rhodesiae JS60]|nr:hypothetical protein MycrhDRAFT_5704 [Mycolicibacterium rhodesiae JS60]